MESNPIKDTDPVSDSAPASSLGFPRKTLVMALLCAVSVGAVALIAALYYFPPLHTWIARSLSYAFVVLPSLIALGTIRFKDWDKFNPLWFRWVVISFVFIACAGGVIFQYNQREEREKADILSRANTESLKGQVSATRKSQDENTKQFLDAFQLISDKLNVLQTKVATDALQSELTAVKGELEKTQDALAPAPQAKVVFSFEGFRNPSDPNESIVPIHEVSLPANSKGLVTIRFSLINVTGAAALQGNGSILICDACKFASEPVGMDHVAGTSDTVRAFQFDQLLAFVSGAASMDIIVPPGVKTAEIGF